MEIGKCCCRYAPSRTGGGRSFKARDQAQLARLLLGFGGKRCSPKVIYLAIEPRDSDQARSKLRREKFARCAPRHRAVYGFGTDEERIGLGSSEVDHGRIETARDRSRAKRGIEIAAGDFNGELRARFGNRRGFCRQPCFASRLQPSARSVECIYSKDQRSENRRCDRIREKISILYTEPNHCWESPRFY